MKDVKLKSSELRVYIKDNKIYCASQMCKQNDDICPRIDKCKILKITLSEVDKSC